MERCRSVNIQFTNWWKYILCMQVRQFTGGVADPRRLLSDWLSSKNHVGDHGLNENC